MSLEDRHGKDFACVFTSDSSSCCFIRSIGQLVHVKVKVKVTVKVKKKGKGKNKPMTAAVFDLHFL